MKRIGLSQMRGMRIVSFTRILESGLMYAENEPIDFRTYIPRRRYFIYGTIIYA